MKLFLFFLAHFCKNCIHFRDEPYDTRMQRSVCLKFDGKMSEICRYDETKCGSEGRYYIAKDPTPDPNILSCNNCKYYEPSFHRCKLFRKINDVTGIANLEYTEVCRRNESKCGKYGKFFTPYKV
jgi:hypothetical protein